MFVNVKEIYKCLSKVINLDFPTQFCLGSISNKFDSNDIKEVTFKGSIYDFSVDYNVTDKSDILNIHKYLMIKNNIWNVSLFKKMFIGLLSFSESLATKRMSLNNEQCSY